MKCVLLFFTLIASSLNAQVLFRMANSFEKDQMHHAMIAFYAGQLMEAGLFKTKKEAEETARVEIGQERLDHQNQIFCVITSEDAKTQYGYLVYSLEGQNAYLDAIYLEEEHRGQGVGKQALQQLETALLEDKIDQLKLYVFDYNQRAIHLYNKSGYEIETTYYVEDKPTGHHMKKQLTAVKLCDSANERCEKL